MELCFPLRFYKGKIVCAEKTLQFVTYNRLESEPFPEVSVDVATAAQHEHHTVPRVGGEFSTRKTVKLRRGARLSTARHTSASVYA